MIDFFSIPPITLSVAFSNYNMPTDDKLSLAAIIAASLTTFEISAPLKPGVRVAHFLAYSDRVFLAFNLIFLRWTL